MNRRRFWVAATLLAGAWVTARELGTGIDVADVSLSLVTDVAAALGFFLLSLARGRAVGMTRARVTGLLLWLVASVAVFVAAATVIARRGAVESEWGELTAVGALLVSGASWIHATMTWLTRMDAPDDADQQHEQTKPEATVHEPRDGAARQRRRRTPSKQTADELSPESGPEVGCLSWSWVRGWKPGR